MATVSVLWLLPHCGGWETASCTTLGKRLCFDLPHANPIPVNWEAGTAPPTMELSNSKIILTTSK